MPRIAALTLDQINRRFDDLDLVQNQITEMQKRLNNFGQSINIADPIHAPITTNNLIFTWTGGSATLSWITGYIKDKNWNTQTTAIPAVISSAKGHLHTFQVPAGSLTNLNPSTYYWLGWDSVHRKMLATTDASTLHANFAIHIICQVYTGTVGQTGVAGGGGSTSGVDLSGLRYKNF